MTVQLREGAEVRSSDGTKLGDVQRLVIAPSSRTVTHLVVSKGFFFPEERVVPLGLVAAGDQDTVTLSEPVELDALPRYEETYYVTVDDSTAGQIYPGDRSRLVIWGYPIYSAAPSMPLYPSYPAEAAQQVERHVPAGSRVVEAGASVVAADGEDVGKVREADISDDGTLVSISVDPGWFEAEQVIPAHFISEIQEDRVVLAVGAKTLERLSRDINPGVSGR